VVKYPRSALRSRDKQRLVIESRHPSDSDDPFEQWAYDVQHADDPTRRELLIEFGQSAGWVGEDGEVLDPNATGVDRLNADLRRAAGLAPRLRTLFGDPPRMNDEGVGPSSKNPSGTRGR
jgi:hypothetical protein